MSPLTARRLRPLLASLLILVAILGAPGPSTPQVASATPLPDGPAFPFTPGECGPPSTTIPGPPPELIAVGKPMSDSWLMCYIQRDFEGQTFSFAHWGEAYKAMFRGYPVECWNQEVDPATGGRQTEGIVAQIYGWNLDHTQYVRFTYRIQLDGDYINNCKQEILPAP
ncbi:MAG: hypothetical protein IT306_06715 [Chloroflexi bacterium]|nr:hypothetical protein [Chloroflexota bacterium]